MIANTTKRLRAFRNTSALTGPVTALGAMSVLFGAGPAHALDAGALPTDPNVVGGKATFSQPNSTTLNVNQSTNRTVIDWRSFDIGSNATTNFIQPNSSSIAVNRVNASANPTEIEGHLNANGQVWILNPNGVLFGKMARVDAAGIVASTANIDVGRFMAGDTRLHMTGADHGFVENRGSITVGQSGLAAFVAPAVRNSGTITATVGKVTLAAGTTYTLDLAGDNLVEIGLGAGKAIVDQSGKIINAGGQITLTAKAASQVVDSVVNVSGVVDASSAHMDGGTIVLGGDDINTTATAQLKADGGTAGTGNGGTITSVAAKTGTYDGSFSARGGATGGDGGHIETSGHTANVASGLSVDASAPKGAAGTWTLDPSDVTIDSTLAGTIETTLAGGTSTEVSTAGGTGGSGDVTLTSSVNASATNGAGLTITGRHLSETGGSTINISGLGSSLILNVNAVNASSTPSGSWISDALAMIGTVDGGSTVNLGAGTYALSSTLNFNKDNVTLSGAGEGSTILDSSSTGYGIYVNADDVALSSFTFNASGAHVSGAYGIKVSPGGAASSRLLNFAIDHVTINGSYNTGLDLNGVLGATIDNVNVNDTAWGNGISLTDSANVTVTNTTTTNNAWGGLAIYQANRSYDQQVNNITIDGTNTFNEANGIYAQNQSTIYSDFGTIDLTGQGINYVAKIDAGYVTPTDYEGTYTLFQKTKQGAIDQADGLNAKFSVTGATVQGYSGTNADGNNIFYVGLATNTDPLSIQAAVNTASSGGAINVDSGTYQEQVVIDKSLTLDGAGAGNTIISSPDTLSHSFTANSSSYKAVVSIENGATVGVSNLTVDGRGQGSSNYKFLGIGIYDASADIENVDITGVRDGGPTGSLGGIQAGVGIEAYNDDGTARTVTLKNSTIGDFQKNATAFVGGNLTVDIEGNTITGAGSTGVTAQNGIELWGVSGVGDGLITGTISGNTITDISYSPVSNWSSTDILIIDANNLQITGNTVTGTVNTDYSNGIYLSGVTNSTISGNILSNLGWALDADAYYGATSGLTITGNNFSNNFEAIYLDSSIGAPTLSGNTFTSNLYQMEGTTAEVASALSNNTFDATAVDSNVGTAIFGDLQTAIGAASVGDNLDVTGTFTTNGQVDINKNLSITGDASARATFAPGTDYIGSNEADAWFLVDQGVNFSLSNVVIDGSGHTVYQGIRNEGNTTIDNVDFRNIAGSAGGSPYRGVAIESFGGTVPGGAGSDSNGSGGSAATLTVTDSTFENIGREGILVKGTGSTATITGNTYTGKGAGDWLDYGIEIGAGGSATITGNTITDALGVASVDGSNSAGIMVTTYYGAGSSATIQDNIVTGNSVAVDVGYDTSDTSTVIAHGNDFSGNTSAVELEAASATADFTGNWWGAADARSILNSMTGADGKSVNFSSFLTSGTDTDGSTVGFQGDFSNLTVTSLGGGTGRIDEAVSLVDAGGTVNVNVGTYDETLDISKAVDIEGAGVGQTIIQPTSLLSTGVGHKYTSNMQTSVYVHDTTGVTINDLTIDGNNLGNDAIVFWNNASGTISNALIENAMPFSGDQTGQGIAVDVTTGHTSDLTVDGVTIQNFNKNAIDAETGDATSAGNGTVNLTVTGSTFTGAGYTSTIAQNGIVLWEQHGGTVNASIDGSTFSGFGYTDPTSATAAGVLQYGSPNGVVSVSNSTFDNTQVYISTAGGVAHELDATVGNTFDGVAASLATLDQLFAIQNHIEDGLTDTTNSLVRLVPNNIYLTSANGDIQNAVDVASAGNTINVQAGTYSGFGTSFGGPADLTIQTSEGAVIDASSVPTSSITRTVDLRADGTTISGFTIIGNGHDVGISISGQGVTAGGNTISDTLTGIQTTTQYTTGNVTITGNTIDAQYGISLQNADDTVTGNTVTASVEGVGLIHSAGATFSGNTFNIGTTGNALDYYGTASSADLAASDNTVNIAGGGLQGAVDLAGTDGTLNLAAGTYTLASEVDITNDGLTLTGAGQGSTLIDATGAAGLAGIRVFSSNVSLSDFALSSSAGSYYGIWFTGTGAVGGNLSNASVANVTVNVGGYNGVGLRGVVGGTVDHVTTNAVNPDTEGFFVDNAANITLINDVTNGGLTGLVIAQYDFGNGTQQQVDNISVDASNTFSGALPVTLWTWATSPVQMGSVNIAGYGYAAHSSDASTNYTYLQTTEQGAIDTFDNPNAATDAAYVTGWTGTGVDTNFYVGTTTGGTVLSINTAVGASAAGDTINVGSGTYTEDVTDNKQLAFDFGTVSLNSLALNSGADGSSLTGSLTVSGGISSAVSAALDGTFTAAAIDLGGATTLTGDTTLDTSGSNGDVTLASLIGGGNDLIVSTGTGTASLGDVANGGALSISGASTLTGTSYAASSENFGGVVTLTGDTTLDTAAGNGVVSLASVNGGSNGLTVSTGAGTATLGNVSSGGALSVSGASTLTGSSYLASSESFGGAVTLTDVTTLDTTGANGNVTVASVTGGGNDLYILTGAGTASLGNVADAGILNTSGPATLTGTNYVAKVLDLEGTLTLTGNTTFDTSAANGVVTLGAIIGAGHDATVTSGTAMTFFLGDVSGVGALSTTAETTLLGTSYVAGSEAFGGTVYLFKGDTTLDTSAANGDVTLPTVDAGGHGLTISTGTGTTSLGNLANGGALSVSGASTLTGTSYVASSESFGGALTLTGDTTLDTSASNGKVTLASVTGGGTDLTISTGTGTTSLGNVANGGALNVSGAATLTGTSYVASSEDFGGAVTLTGNTTLDISASNGAITTAAINGTTAGGQGLTIDAGTGAVSLGSLGGTTRLAAVTVTGPATLTGSTYAGNSLAFANDVTLTQGNTTFNTSAVGGDITVAGNIFGTTNGAQSLALVAGTGTGSLAANGDISLQNVGTSSVRLGDMSVTGGNFSAATVYLAGNFTSQLVGNQVFTSHTLNAGGSVSANVGGNATGPINSGSTVSFNVGGNLSGSVTGTTIGVTSGSVSNASFTGTNINVASGTVSGASLTGTNVTVTSGSISSTSVSASGQGTISADTIEGQFSGGSFTLTATNSVNATVDANTVTLSSPTGTVDGTWTTLDSSGTSTVDVNGETRVGDGGAGPNQIVVEGFTLPAGALVTTSGQIVLPQGVLIGLLSPAGASGKPRIVLVHSVRMLGQLLADGYTAIVIDLNSGKDDDLHAIQLASN